MGAGSIFVHRRYEDRRMQQLAAAAGAGTVLDVGYAQYPNPYFRARQVTGIDLDPAPGPELTAAYDELLVGDASDLGGPLGDRSFDAVVAGELIEHLEDPFAFLRSLHQRIGAGGRLVLSTPNAVSFPVVLAEWTRVRQVFYTEDHRFLTTPRWLDRMLDRAGYEVLERRGVGLWLPPLPPVRCPLSLSYQLLYVARPVTPSDPAAP